MNKNKKELSFDNFETGIVIKLSGIVETLNCINNEFHSEISDDLQKRINNLIEKFDDTYKNKIIKPKCEKAISSGFTKEEFKNSLEQFFLKHNISNLESRISIATELFEKELVLNAVV